MKEWQFDVLFLVAVGGTVFLLIAPAVGLEAIPKNPTAVGGIGVMLAFVLQQKYSKDKESKEEKKDEGANK